MTRSTLSRTDRENILERGSAVSQNHSPQQWQQPPQGWQQPPQGPPQQPPQGWQPYQGQPPPQPPQKKNHGACKGIGGGVAALFALIVILSALTGNDDDSSSKDEAKASSSKSSTTTKKKASSGKHKTKKKADAKPKKKPAKKIGDTIKSGPFQFTVTNVQKHVSHIGDKDFGTDADGQYVLVSVRVKNASDKAHYFDGDDHKLSDQNNKEYSSDTEAGIDLKDNDTFLNKINPGNKVNGKIVYDVPKKVNPNAINFSGGGLFSSPVKVQLK